MHSRMELTAEKGLRQAPAAPELEQWGLTLREIIEIESWQEEAAPEDTGIAYGRSQRARPSLKNAQTTQLLTSTCAAIRFVLMSWA